MTPTSLRGLRGVSRRPGEAAGWTWLCSDIMACGGLVGDGGPLDCGVEAAPRCSCVFGASGGPIAEAKALEELRMCTSEGQAAESNSDLLDKCVLLGWAAARPLRVPGGLVGPCMWHDHSALCPGRPARAIRPRSQWRWIAGRAPEDHFLERVRSALRDGPSAMGGMLSPLRHQVQAFVAWGWEVRTALFGSRGPCHHAVRHAPTDKRRLGS